MDFKEYQTKQYENQLSYVQALVADNVPFKDCELVDLTDDVIDQLFAEMNSLGWTQGMDNDGFEYWPPVKKWPKVA